MGNRFFLPLADIPTPLAFRFFFAAFVASCLAADNLAIPAFGLGVLSLFDYACHREAAHAD